MFEFLLPSLSVRKHYKEYLVDRINKAKLDPLPLYEDIAIILKREEKPVPEKEEDETDEHYRERLIAVGAVCPSVTVCCYVRVFPCSM